MKKISHAINPPCLKSFISKTVTNASLKQNSIFVLLLMHFYKYFCTCNQDNPYISRVTTAITSSLD